MRSVFELYLTIVLPDHVGSSGTWLVRIECRD